MIEPLVSACLITYNHERFIEDCINGALKQILDCPYEIVIGEDCSTDQTRILCRRYEKSNKPKIRMLSGPKNLGMMGNWIRSIGACRGKYIAICEGDDYWVDPHKLRKQVDFLENHPDYGMVYTDMRIVDEGGEEIQLPGLEDFRSKYRSGAVFYDLLSMNFIPTLTVVFRKNVIDWSAIGDHELSYIYDYWYWLRMAVRHKVHFLNERTACYRQHEMNITKTDYIVKRQGRVEWDALIYHYRQCGVGLNRVQKRKMFKKCYALLWDRFLTVSEKIRLLSLMARYAG